MLEFDCRNLKIANFRLFAAQRLCPMPFINRELSWIEFNQRVLEIAKEDGKPLLERLKFLAITASNFDEFFQVRVGGLAMQRRSGSRKSDIAGMTPTQQLDAITTVADQLGAEAIKSIAIVAYGRDHTADITVGRIGYY